MLGFGRSRCGDVEREREHVVCKRTLLVPTMLGNLCDKELKKQLKELFSEKEIITLIEIYSKKSRQIIYDYLKETRIATRDWLLGLEKEEDENSERAVEEEEEEEIE
jgi:hypothetical protein